MSRGILCKLQRRLTLIISFQDGCAFSSAAGFAALVCLEEATILGFLMPADLGLAGASLGAASLGVRFDLGLSAVDLGLAEAADLGFSEVDLGLSEAVDLGAVAIVV